MNYWYLKEGDVLGPMTAEEIAKDASFTEDSLVCPQDKAEQAEFWKPAQTYAQDFAALLSGDMEMEIPPEVALDDIEIDYSSQENSKEGIKEPNTLEQDKEAPSSIFEPRQEEPVKIEDKNPFESDRPQIAPNIEDTISSHGVAPRLDADGDTLLEDIPAKAILGEEEKDSSDISFDKDFVESSSLTSEDTLEDTPILNIFERSPERHKTKELKDISENIYDTYGADNNTGEGIKIRATDQEDKREKQEKNNKIYLLLIVMFVLVVIALVLALLGGGEESKPASRQTSPQNSLSAEDKSLLSEKEVLAMPTTDTAVFANTTQANLADKQAALLKLKGFVLPSSITLEGYLNRKYGAYQTSWVADVLSGRNYYVHFNANKVRQEPIVYSFSIDLDKNEINGLNNLGIDLLMKGE